MWARGVRLLRLVANALLSQALSHTLTSPQLGSTPPNQADVRRLRLRAVPFAVALAGARHAVVPVEAPAAEAAEAAAVRAVGVVAVAPGHVAPVAPDPRALGL